MIQHGYSVASGKTIIEIKDNSLQLNSNNQLPKEITLNDNELEELLGVPSVDQVNDSMRLTLNRRQDQSASNPEIDENGDKELAELNIPSLAECRKQINLGLTLNQSGVQKKDDNSVLQENSDDDITQLTGLTLEETRKQMGLKL